MVGAGVGRFFWGQLEGCLYAFGVVIPALGVALGDDDRVLAPAVYCWAARVRGEAFSFEEGFPCNRLVGLLPWARCDEEVAVY